MKFFNRLGETVRSFIVSLKEKRATQKQKKIEEYAQRDKLHSDPEYLRGHWTNAEGTAWKIIHNNRR